MKDPQSPGCASDCQTCEHFRRGVAAATAAGNQSLASDGRVLLARHQKVVAEGGPMPWWPAEPAYTA
jgi:hypothetical protein